MIERLHAVPLRMRAASNPGGPGHEWVKRRFGIYRPEGEDERPRLCHRPEWVRRENRVFLPATLRDNPHLDTEEYLASLGELDEVTRRQLELGDWDAKEAGEYFRREFFEIVDVLPDAADCRFVRYWDLAATEPSERNEDPDWTVGLRMAKHPNGTYYIADVRRMRRRSDAVEHSAHQAAEEDGKATSVWIEQEPGASGKALILHWQRDVLAEYEVRGHAPSDSKGVRARPVASKAEAGLVKLVRGAWNTEFLDELEAFAPGADEDSDAHDDQVDALSGAFTVLSQTAPAKSQSYRGGRGQEPEVVEGDIRLKGERYIDK
jgi:predicted phage terminase large subunit-like protein